MSELQWMQQITIWALPVLFAITAHEAAHAFAAKKCGDSTAYMLGRMTFNPVKHIDPIGTIILPILCIVLQSGIVFGWAKPVPINVEALNNPKRDMRWVAVAGPLANLVMAVLWAVILRLSDSLLHGFSLHYPLLLMAQAGVTINLLLMILNLLPIPPLDGGRILLSVLPAELARKAAFIEPYGIIILVVLLYTRILDAILQPLFALSVKLLSVLFL